MTVIVWDGETLAADRMASDRAAKWRTDKIVVNDEQLVTGVGPAASIHEVMAWYLNGKNEDSFPQCQLDPDKMCNLIVVSPRIGLVRYENLFTPVTHGFSQCAFGEGRDFAYGALASGANAEDAVRAANQFSLYCGLGVQSYRYTEGEWHGQTTDE